MTNSSVQNAVNRNQKDPNKIQEFLEKIKSATVIGNEPQTLRSIPPPSLPVATMIPQGLPLKVKTLEEIENEMLSGQKNVDQNVRRQLDGNKHAKYIYFRLQIRVIRMLSKSQMRIVKVYQQMCQVYSLALILCNKCNLNNKLKLQNYYRISI